jgi:phage repressor protein C with HTH and peptisase S24 domain
MFRVLKMNTLADRLTEVMKELGLEKPKDLADFCGVSEGLVSQWFSGRTKLGPKPLRAFSRTQFNLDWITDGRLPKYRAEESGVPAGFRRVIAVDDDDPRLTIIPKVKLRLTAGLSGFEVEPEAFDGSTTTVPTDWIERRGYRRDDLIAITVRGESMEPTFYEGDLVVINTADTQPVAGSVFAVNYEGEPAIKRLKRDMGRWWLVSDNADQRQYYPVTFEGDTSKIIGRIVRKETERF